MPEASFPVIRTSVNGEAAGALFFLFFSAFGFFFSRFYVADAYSIADIAIWPWVSRYEWQTVDLNAYPNVKRWYISIASRPAVLRGYNVPKDVGGIPIPA